MQKETDRSTVHTTERPAWRDVVLNKLDHYCTGFNRGWNRGQAWFKGIAPYIAVAVAVLFLWNETIPAGLHSWVTRHPSWVYYLNRHDELAYAYGVGLFLAAPLFFSIALAHGVFRLVRAVQWQRQKRLSSKTQRYNAL